MSGDTTAALAEFVAGLDYLHLPARAVALTKRQCLDLVGVALAGSSEEAGRLAASVATRFGPEPSATIWGGSLTSPPGAAFANGVAGHALDYDDFWLPGAHPTAPILPAAFAVAEWLGASGKDLIIAQLGGYEVMGRLHAAAAWRGGWHPTGVFGAFGAAAACARLLDCSPIQVATALGIAASSTSGVDAHEGTMTKPFHAGQAARSGLVAGLLAADGFTASTSVLDPGHGFFEAFYPGCSVDRTRITADLGERFWIEDPGIGIKMQPAGYYMLQTFEAALKIVTGQDLDPSEVASVEIGVRPNSRFDRASVASGLEGKFSLQYVATMAIVNRALVPLSFSDAMASSEVVRATMAKMRSRVDRDLPEDPAVRRNPVTITCTDGRSFTEEVVMTRSHWQYPLTEQEWVGKFTENASPVLGPETAARVREAMLHLEEVKEVGEVAALLARR